MYFRSQEILQNVTVEHSKRVQKYLSNNLEQAEPIKREYTMPIVSEIVRVSRVSPSTAHRRGTPCVFLFLSLFFFVVFSKKKPLTKRTRLYPLTLCQRALPPTPHLHLIKVSKASPGSCVLTGRVLKVDERVKRDGIEWPPSVARARAERKREREIGRERTVRED